MIRRALRRLMRPLRLAIVEYMARRSREHVIYLRSMRTEALRLEAIELRTQIRLAERASRLERQ